MTAELKLTDARILIVDDEFINLDVLKEILGMEGYDNLTLTESPTEAIKLFKAEEFDLLLLDILMPELDGFQVLEQIHELKEKRKIPVLILTALNDHATKLKALENGANDFLGKPFDAAEALARIKNLLKIRFSQKQLHQSNLILDQKVKERTLELNQTLLEITRRLGRAAEYRDNETGLHIIRMSLYARTLAEHIGFNENALELLENAAPMHDIGKIGIPDSILLKPGRLNEEEMSIMKTHTTIGAKILGNHPSALLKSACQIALTHHERWDGLGYPNAISKTEIPLEGRITAVADIFDALTSKRPYKDPWPIEHAIKFINDNREKIFDPELSDAFLEIIPKIEIIKEKYSE